MEHRSIKYVTISGLMGVIFTLGVPSISQASTIVLNGTVDLLCDIPEYDSGINIIDNVVGTGITFDATTSPLVNPELQIFGTSLSYTFNATLASPVEANIGGIGDGTITSMTIDVQVAASSFEQPNGLGTTIFIDASDITPDSSELIQGNFIRQSDGKAFAFNAKLSGFSQGSVLLEPESADPVTGLERKVLEIFSADISGQVASVPEPTSTLSLLALGTLGAASTLKRKQKQKSTEKETTKVS